MSGVLRVGEAEEIDKTYHYGGDRGAKDPAASWSGRNIGVAARAGLIQLSPGLRLAVELVLIGEDPGQELQAVAASTATCSWSGRPRERVRSSTSMWRSQSKRRAHSNARSPVAWLLARSSSSATIPAA